MSRIDVEETPVTPRRAPELHGLLATLERSMHLSVSHELGRVESSVEALFADLETRLADAHHVIDALREENAALVRENERIVRALETIRDLWDEEAL